ncbi:hypothetical protein GR212_15680 [Rhizobium lusitanum]|uniref:Uncharacterized protein n=1 Tax=Rhizobium lusitanum TaxID=293958 RepID=A0A6L9U6I7_9HYPH|nr:hypothetical protein [Rhizobium lusitanum]NEI71019.1 hypothetical protein [Rhizobium lusitanum]
MTKPPLCRYCGKALKKKVVSVSFNSYHSRTPGGRRSDRPASREEAQKLFNEKIVSIKYRHDELGRYVAEVGLWDRESYVDKFFCKNAHAQDFAYSALRYKPELGTQVYFEALEKQTAD